MTQHHGFNRFGWMLLVFRKDDEKLIRLAKDRVANQGTPTGQLSRAIARYIEPLRRG